MELLNVMLEKKLPGDCYSSLDIVFFGDSITEGCFESVMNSQNEQAVISDPEAVYHAQFKRIFNGIWPAIPLNIINSGIGGETASQAKQRIETDVVKYEPDLAVVCFGLNDVMGGMEKISDYEASLSEMFVRLKTAKTDIIFMTPNMMNTYVGKATYQIKGLSEIALQTKKYQTDGTMDAYMECAKNVCRKYNITVCDCYAKWKHLYNCGVDTTALLANGINHPNRAMHGLFAQELFSAVFFGRLPAESTCGPARNGTFQRRDTD